MEPNPKGQYEGITLGSGRELEPPKPKISEDKSKEGRSLAYKKASKPLRILVLYNASIISTPFPFPQRFQEKKFNA